LVIPFIFEDTKFGSNFIALRERERERERVFAKNSLVTAAVFGFKFSLMISVGSEAQQNVINQN